MSDGYNLFYDVVGHGSSIVFIHDGLLPSSVWDEQVAAFATTHRVVRYDRRGYGGSVLPDQPYSNIADLQQLMDRLSIDDAILVGASGGGGLALDFTLAYPTRVQRLVLVGSTLTGLSFSEQFHRRMQELFRPLVEARDMAATIERWASDPYLVAGDKPQARDRIRALLQANPNALINPQHFIQPPPSPTAADLARLNHPTLIIIGEADIGDVHAHAGAIEFGLRRAQRIVVSSAGHLVYLEYPAKFNQLVHAFIHAD
ncbi:MAG: alpha/beta hydrolase [Chloroflexales bacterium]|nr:alpha/beta hydrolase [Chloroflexales bacterium]